MNITPGCGVRMGGLSCTRSNYFNQVNLLNLQSKNVPEGLVQINPKIG